ncbi:alpha/beta hydrolase [Candidatus Leptofilum sp.]|uniref:alpha/beta hydrolase n=1 Tax=Candidatus Leptofilum sp. TaxID=3241576 RepID=UPI003B5CDB2F
MSDGFPVELLFVVPLLIFYYFFRPYYAAYLFVRPPRMKIAYFTPTNLGVTYEDVVLTSQDGVKLAGWYIPSRNQAAVILLHGHSGNRLGVVHQAEALLQAGYGILMYDLRAHGSSGGRRFARGQSSVDDVLAAVAYLSKRPDVQPGGIGAMGVSVGGMFALQAAAQTVAIRAVGGEGTSPAVLADVPAPTAWWRQFAYRQQKLYMRFILRFARQKSLPSNAAAAARLGQRPLLLIATGAGDEAKMLQNLADKVETAVFWQIPEARHGQGWHTRQNEYNHRLVAFFNEALSRQEQTQSVPPEEE